MANYLKKKVGIYTYFSKNGKSGYTLNNSVTLLDVLTSDHEDKTIERYRKTKDPKIKEALPSFTPGGYYPEKRVKNVRPHESTNLVQLDIDGKSNSHVKDWKKLRDKLFTNHKWIAVCSLSCGGNGLFVLVNTPDWDNYERYFNSLCYLFQESIGLMVDPAVSSANELRYITHSKGVVFREDAELYTSKKDREKTSIDYIHVDGNGELIRVSDDMLGKIHYQHASSFIGKNNQNGTPQHVVTSYLVEHRTKIFDKTSHLYKDAEAIKEYVQKMYASYAHQHAIVRKRKDEKFNWFDIPGMMAEIGFTKSDVTYELWYNGALCAGSDAHVMLCNMFPKTQITVSNFISIHESSAIPTFDEFKQAYDSLPTWDGKDRVTALCKCFRVPDVTRFENMMRKKLVRMIACNLAHYVDRTVLALGGEQNIGKTYFLKWLCPFPEYYVSAGLKDDKDTKIRFAKAMMWVIDEMGSIMKQDNNVIKNLISIDLIRERPPFGRIDKNFKRRASLWASFNGGSPILNDDQNTRYIIFDVEKIDFKYDKIDHKQLWAQVYHLYNSGFDYVLTPEELKQNEGTNDDYRFQTLEEQILEHIALPCTPNIPPGWSLVTGNASMIGVKMEKIMLGYRINPKAIGQALHKLGFKMVRSNGKNVYQLMLKNSIDALELHPKNGAEKPDLWSKMTKTRKPNPRK